MTVDEAIEAGVFVPLPPIKWLLMGAYGRVRRDLSHDAREIAGVIGVGLFALLRKAHRRRTKTGWLSIPRTRTIPSGHWIRAAIGDNATDALQTAVRDRKLDYKLDIRGREIATRAERDDWVRWRCWAGESVADVAREFGLTERQVRNLV